MLYHIYKLYNRGNPTSVFVGYKSCKEHRIIPEVLRAKNRYPDRALSKDLIESELEMDILESLDCDKKEVRKRCQDWKDLLKPELGERRSYRSEEYKDKYYKEKWTEYNSNRVGSLDFDEPEYDESNCYSILSELEGDCESHYELSQCLSGFNGLRVTSCY